MRTTAAGRAQIQRMRAETIMRSGGHNPCSVCISTEYPGQLCNCQCPVCVAAQPASAPRFAITASVHGWSWTYTSIRAAEAQWIADTLTAGSGETWTVTALGAAETVTTTGKGEQEQ